MKKTFVFMAMLCMAAMFSSTLASAQTLTCTKYPASVTFTIDGDLADWPADAKVLDGYSIADVGNHSAGPVEADIVFNVWLAWDNTYLYMAYEVTSDADAGLDSGEPIGARYLDDMFRLYLETNADGGINDGPDNDEFGVDLRASTTGPLNEIVVISWNAGNFADPSDTNRHGSANGSMVATTAADGATAYIWEARVAWADILDHGTAYSKTLSVPQDGDTWTWDMLLIDDGPSDGQQFNLTTLHAPTGWQPINFVDSSVTPVTAGVPLIHDGLYAAKITRDAAGVDSGFDINDAKVDVTGITTLNISWWMRSGSEADATIAAMGVASFDSAQAHLPGYGEPNLVDGDNVVGTDWEFRSADFTVPGADVNFINLGIRLAVGSSLVIDDVKIVDTANPDVNLVANGSFEDWGNGVIHADVDTTVVAENGGPDSWRFFGVGGANATIERVGSAIPTNVQEGRYSAKYTRTVLGGDSALDKDFAPAPDGHIDITGIDEMQISFWMRSDTGAPITLVPQVQTWVGTTFTPPNPSPFAYFNTNQVPPTWTYYSFTYTRPADITDLSLRFGLGTAGDSFIIDGASIINTATGEDILPNGGFEDWGGGNVTGDPVVPNGSPDFWRIFAVGGAGAMLERLEFQPAPPNTVKVDWTWMQ